MNEKTFIQLLDRLEPADWQALADGRCLLMVDDLDLAVGACDAPNVVLRAARPGQDGAGDLRRDVLSGAGELLSDYYRTHPLTRAGFDHQVRGLIDAHGAAAFAAAEGRLPALSLFVDGGEVVAESPDSPRHRYGAYCELARPVSAQQAEQRVRQWLERGEAHARYLGMNACRYHC